MHSNIDHAMQRTRRYWYEDGLGEIAKGSIFLLIGLVLFVQELAPPGALPKSFSALALPLVVLGGIVLASRLVAAAKARSTYPRTGYVAYRRPSLARRLATATLAMAVSALVAALTLRPEARPFLPIVQGAFLGAVFLYLGFWLGLSRFYAMAVLAVLTGGGAYLAGRIQPEPGGHLRHLGRCPDSFWDGYPVGVPAPGAASAARVSMEDGLRSMVNADRVIHEPARLVIAAILFGVESADFLYLLRETGLTKGNLSSHLARLEEAGYVKIDKSFRGKVPQTVCTLTERGRAAFREYRAQLKSAFESMPE